MLKRLGLIIYVTIFVALPVILIFWYPAFSTLEGRFMPVVKDVELLSAGSVGDGVITYWSFTKARDCDWLDLAFYEGRRDGAFSIIATDLNPDGGLDTSRPPGDNVAGPWMHFATSPPELWFVDVRHRCHPLWVTRTRFWN